MTSEDYNNSLLATLREEKNLTQQNVADALEVSRYTVIRAEQGTSASWKLLGSFATFYGISINDLVTKQVADV